MTRRLAGTIFLLFATLFALSCSRSAEAPKEEGKGDIKTYRVTCTEVFTYI
jgi:hypothetical protein